MLTPIETRSMQRKRDRPELDVAGAARSRQLVRAAADEVLEGVPQGQREADADDHQLDEPETLAPQGSPQARIQSAARARRPARSTMGMTIHIGQREPHAEARAATMAPKVSISPCAKFVSPVVPKMSETPIAASASSRPKFRPFISRIEQLIEEDSSASLALAEEAG